MVGSIENDLSDEQLYSIAMHISGVKPSTVCICGGEPILRKNIVYKIIKYSFNYCGAVNMVSNVYLITQDITNKLKENGLLTLQISLDGDTPFNICVLGDENYSKASRFINFVKCENLFSFTTDKNYNFFSPVNFKINTINSKDCYVGLQDKNMIMVSKFI